MLHLSGDAGAIAARKAERQTGDGPRQEVKNTRFCPSSEKFHTVVLKGGRNIYDALENLPVKFLVKISSLSIFHLLRFVRRRGGRCRCWQRPRARRRGPLAETTGRRPCCETLGMFSGSILPEIRISTGAVFFDLTKKLRQIAGKGNTRFLVSQILALS